MLAALTRAGVADDARSLPRARPIPPVPGRDQRLDFFRGLLQIFIFIGHVPDNPFTWLIHRSWGFSDSSELFVLFSGWVLGSLGARTMAKSGWRSATRDLLRRALRLYLRHGAIFVLFSGMMLGFGWLSQDRYWPDGIGLDVWLQRPALASAWAVLLTYQPVFLDILPLFVVLMLCLPLQLALPLRWGLWGLAPAFLLWLGVQITKLGPPTWPEGTVWHFNPAAWQLMFVIGAVLGRASLWQIRLLPRPDSRRGRVLLGLAGLVLLAGAIIKPSWLLANAGWPVPALLDELLWPLDKTNLGWLPLLHALALAWVVGSVTTANAPWYGRGLAAWVARCGRFSLDVFCLGLFLSMMAHFVLRQIDDHVLTSALVQIGGIGVLLTFAGGLERRLLRAIKR